MNAMPQRQKEIANTCNNMDNFQRRYTERKKLDTKSTSCMIPFIQNPGLGPLL